MQKQKLIRLQNSELLKDFGPYLDHLLSLIIELEADTQVNSPCICGNGLRTTRCNECSEYALSCKICFIAAHRHSPYHWAEVWNAAKGFFVRHDISALAEEGFYAYHLGHNGGRCPNLIPGKEVTFTVVDTNGVHATRIGFCACLGCSSKVDQLMCARLFPATTRDPQTAFTFTTLIDFHLHNLESKKAAYDYLGALRRLTDNSFSADVPVSCASMAILPF